ncbi:Phosphatidylethanolamine N-methyltransferase [Liparis tanakae]|uniref:Phosphatidylethanolamine N-methyltransferase n=1 Tax=Liparis tanakae TaxID=230148 RepID=A0A4Z2FQ68_9TELE|nr:Phosphatidylethanolamine N-methyltransferase [Liparis tanakae]
MGVAREKGTELNGVARWEHRTRALSRLFGGPYLACYCLAFVILLLNVYRSHSVTEAMRAQASWEAMERADVFYAGVALVVLGTVLVVSSFLALGFTGTFLGGGASPVGLVLTAIVAVVYKVAIHFEGPFTEMIYRERAERRKRE